MAGQDQAEGFYGPLGESLSQGDIVRVVPTGFIDQPITICQPNNKDPKGKAFYAPHDQVDNPKPYRFLHATGSVGLAMVVWPDCQIDKDKNQKRAERKWDVGVAPIRPLSSLGPQADALAGKIFRFERAQWFPVAGSPEWEPGFVDLRYIWTVRYSLLSDRAAALSADVKRALQLHLFWFQTEAKVQSVSCPECSATLDASLLLQFKDSEAEGTED